MSTGWRRWESTRVWNYKRNNHNKTLISIIFSCINETRWVRIENRIANEHQRPSFLKIDQWRIKIRFLDRGRVFPILSLLIRQEKNSSLRSAAGKAVVREPSVLRSIPVGYLDFFSNSILKLTLFTDVPVAADLKNTPCAPNDYFRIECNTCYCNIEKTGYLCTENLCIPAPNSTDASSSSSMTTDNIHLSSPMPSTPPTTTKILH